MKIYRTSQNITYLNSIGVPANSQVQILNYLLSLDNETRKVILRKLKKNPTMSLEQIQELETNSKKDFLRSQGYPEEVIDLAINLSPKYSIWLAREIKNDYDPNELNPDWHKDKTEGAKISKLFSIRWTSEEINEILDWIKQTNLDIMKLNITEAYEQSKAWHKELAEQEIEEDYISHKVIYTLSNGWEIVELEPGDCEAEGERMGHCVGTYARNIQEGRTQIFSLRDPKNRPHVTVEMSIYDNSKNKPVIEGKPEKPELRADVRQIQGKQNDEPIDEYKTMIKQWFDSMKTQGIKFDPMETQDHIAIKDLSEEIGRADEYGIPIGISGIGGDAETYYKNLKEAYQESWGRSNYWSKSSAEEYIDSLIEYAVQNNELDELQKAIDGFETKTRNRDGKTVKIYEGFNDFINNIWFEAKPYYEFENARPDEYPDKKDFMIQPDISEQQPEFKGMPSPQPVLNEEAYNRAIAEYQEKERLYEEELSRYENDFEAYQFLNYLYQELQKRKKLEENRTNLEQAASQKVKIKMYKIADQSIKDSDIPSPNTLATYVEALKTYLKDSTALNKTLAEQIENLPSPSEIKRSFSFQECKLLFETVNYVWKAITKKDIVDESKIEKSPETLCGNYWMLKNGLLLKGSNHISIIKNNTSLFCSLLNLNAFTLLQYLSSDPNKLIFYIIKNGGMRMFINKDKSAYFQMSEEIYAKWGRKKVKELDFTKKIVKILNFKQKYNGWNSGIAIKL